jgi:signal transduction histidine kinase/CheY-like chemotaxis protein
MVETSRVVERKERAALAERLVHWTGGRWKFRRRFRLVVLRTIVLLAAAPVAGAGFVVALLPFSSGASASSWPLTAGAVEIGLSVAATMAFAQIAVAISAWPLIRHGTRTRVLLAKSLRRRDALREADRIRGSKAYEAAVRRISSSVVHDLNNVLGAIVASADAVDDVSDHAAVREATAAVAANAREALDIGKRLLAFTKNLPLAPRPADLNQILREGLPQLQADTGERNPLVPRLASRPLPVELDPEHLVDCTRELVRNARDASPPGAAITLRTRTEFAEGANNDAGLLAVLEVEDGGTGMSAEQVSAVEAGRIAVDTPHGGFGLSIVSNFARDSAGTLSIRTLGGQGTRVTLRFPLRAPAMTPADAPPRGLKGRAPGGRVLIVDDNDIVRGSIARALGNVGFVTVESEDAASATAALNGGIDALITDVVLPDTDGFALARHARQRDPRVPLIFMSGFISARQPELLANDDLASFMRKPVDNEKLVDVLAGLLATRDGAIRGG